MSAHRVAAAFGGAALVAALTIPGSTAAPAGEAVSAVPAAAAATLGIGAVGSYISAGAVFQIDLAFSCATKEVGSVSVEVHQNVGHGFVANGFGYSRRPLTSPLTNTPRSLGSSRRSPSMRSEISLTVKNIGGGAAAPFGVWPVGPPSSPGSSPRNVSRLTGRFRCMLKTPMREFWPGFLQRWRVTLFKPPWGRAEAVGRVAWALLASMEFGVNH